MATAAILIMSVLSIVLLPIMTNIAASHFPEPNAAIPWLIAWFYLKGAAVLIKEGPILAFGD